MILPENAIEARGLVKVYPATRTTPKMHALRGIDLAVPRGSMFGLLGPNGAGKSTFINILAGMTRKTAGSVSIWGRDIDARPRDARAAIGVVPQEIAADPFFTPKEALEVAAGMYAVPRKERRTMELLEALGLGDKAQDGIASQFEFSRRHHMGSQICCISTLRVATFIPSRSRNGRTIPF